MSGSIECKDFTEMLAQHCLTLDYIYRIIES